MGFSWPFDFVSFRVDVASWELLRVPRWDPNSLPLQKTQKAQRLCQTGRKYTVQVKGRSFRHAHPRPVPYSVLQKKMLAYPSSERQPVWERLPLPTPDSGRCCFLTQISCLSPSLPVHTQLWLHLQHTHSEARHEGHKAKGPSHPSVVHCGPTWISLLKGALCWKDMGWMLHAGQGVLHRDTQWLGWP